MVAIVITNGRESISTVIAFIRNRFIVKITNYIVIVIVIIIILIIRITKEIIKVTMTIITTIISISADLKKLK